MEYFTRYKTINHSVLNTLQEKYPGGEGGGIPNSYRDEIPHPKHTFLNLNRFGLTRHRNLRHGLLRAHRLHLLLRPPLPRHQDPNPI